MNQNIWGPHLWFSLHTMSFNYPLNPNYQDKKQYENFFISMQHVIPCPVCKKNYIRHIKEHPIEKFLENRKSLVYWVIDMHNMVNAETGKKIVSYDYVIKKYETAYQKKIILEDNTSPQNKGKAYPMESNLRLKFVKVTLHCCHNFLELYRNVLLKEVGNL
jgi:hypothetical protein